MKKAVYIYAGFCLVCLSHSLDASAQGAIDAFRLSQPDMKGTARFMGMGGAFGALGGDLSTLSQNPGGIGVYRNSEVGITFDVDVQNSNSETNLGKFSEDRTKFLVNNVGCVWTLKLNSNALPNINLGFTYNRAASFSRRYKGSSRLANSLSNYIASVSNSNQVTEESVRGEWYNSSGQLQQGDPWASSAPWISTLAYESYLISPYYFSDSGNDYMTWEGQWDQGTSGTGSFNVQESGGVDEYNIAIGGNISNVLYWGMDFGITSINYSENSDWGENLENAWIGDIRRNNQFLYSNQYKAWGTGFNYKIGVIVKPIQELRLGFAVHTPTWYSMSESYLGSVGFLNPNKDWAQSWVDTNNGLRGSDSFSFRTPMKIIASAAGVIGGRFIVSADYEWQPYHQMKMSQASDNNWYDYGYGYDDYWGNVWDGWRPSPATRSSFWEDVDPFEYTNKEIKEYFQSQNTLRLGAEYRVTSRFSVRAGYSYVSSPTTSKTYNNETEVMTSGTLTNYRLNDVTNYITCGLGYKVGNFYIDAAYVYKHLTSTFHPYSVNPGVADSAPEAKLGLTNNQIFVSAGFKF